MTATLPEPEPLIAAACDQLLPFTGLTEQLVRGHVFAAIPPGYDRRYARRWEAATERVLAEKFPELFPCPETLF